MEAFQHGVDHILIGDDPYRHSRRITPHIAVIIPCFNEAMTIAQVVSDFRCALPGANVYVFDNNSTDGTTSVARAAGARVRAVTAQGKGNVVRRMFADIEADIYVMVDGDGTYDASAAPRMIETLLRDGLDMVVGARVSDDAEAYRRGHRWGNRLLTGCVAMIFGRSFADMLSGYRVFSRRYAKSFPAHSRSFEIETELAVHALELRMPVAECETPYGARPIGSTSKLHTYRDGVRILLTILALVKAEKPLAFFAVGALLAAGLGGLIAVPVLLTYLETGLVPRLPTAVLSAALMLLAAILMSCGIVLDIVSRGRAEAKRFAYLAQPGPAL